MVEKFLRSVSELKRFEIISISIEVSKDLITLKIDKLSTMLLDIEEKKLSGESLKCVFRPSYEG